MMIEVITFELADGMTREDVLKNYQDTTKKWWSVEGLTRKCTSSMEKPV